MAKPKLEPVAPASPKPLKKSKPMTGVAFTVVASKDQGFCNYRICTLFIVAGELIHQELSQEFASYETIARLEILINSSIWNLSSRYKPGDFQSLGGDARDELVNRLRKTNPGLLELIAPALAMPQEKDEE